MDELDYIKLQLEGIHCELNHGPDTKQEDYPAVDYLVLPLGNEETITDQLVIPVCLECSRGLSDPEWVLLFCIDCCASHWINRLRSRLKYPPRQVIWLRGCPECTEEFGGLYYAENDFPNEPSEDL